MLDVFTETIEKYGLLKDCKKIVLGVSGGADSMAMLHAFLALNESFGVELIVAHVDHSLRENSALDAEHVRQWSASRNVPAIIRMVDVKGAMKRNKTGVEETARDLRYEALRGVCKEVGANRIAVAHNANDQAETILMNILRGSGLKGLCGMHPLNGDVIRPLLFVPRKDILEYCGRNDISYVTDESNEKDEYNRNWIRNSLLPMIRERYNAADVNLSQLAMNVLVEEEYLEAQAYSAYKRCAARELDAIGVDVGAFYALPDALRYRVLSLCFKELGVYSNIQSVHFIAVVKLCLQESGKHIDLPGGLIAHKGYGKLWILKKSAEISIPETAVKMPGITRLPDGANVLRAELCGSVPDLELKSHGRYVQYVDMDKLPGELVLRSRKQGDRFRPIGAPGSKKLKDYFIDKKVERFRRDGLPVMANGGEVYWVVGLGLSEHCRVDKDTKNILKLEYAANDAGNGANPRSGQAH